MRLRYKTDCLKRELEVRDVPELPGVFRVRLGRGEWVKFRCDDLTRLLGQAILASMECSPKPKLGPPQSARPPAPAGDGTVGDELCGPDGPGLGEETEDQGPVFSNQWGVP